MHKATRTHLALMLIFAFCFCYRLLLMLWEGFPPGADIGLHNSVINSITGSGPTDFLYNYYHIGGGISLTFPGYHIFTAGFMIFTGITGPMEYVAHALVVSLFSSLIVLCAFLVTRQIWSTSAACIVALLAAISRFDIEMLMWAGYPNVITLMLIPLTFYLYLQKDRFSTLPFVASTSILVGSLFLTHSLSAGIFIAITIATILVIFIAPQILSTSRKTALCWFLPIVFGTVLVAPFLVQAIPAFLSDNAYLNDSTGSTDIGSATLSARVLPLWIVIPLFGLIPGFMVFSRKLYGRWLTLPGFLLCAWVFVSLILTQGYLVKIPFDYNRFLYFLILPLIMFTGVLIDYGSVNLARVIDTYRSFGQQEKRIMNLRIHRLSLVLTIKNLNSLFALFLLVISFVAVPIFMTPTSTNVGQSIQSYYQTMNPKGWEALQWAKENTASNAVFVSDAEYGWWFGGFAQRPTLSAVDPQYLSLNREVDNATFARNILDTDYIIDNNSTLIPQVRDDGGFIARHNPQILVKQNWTYYPSSFFNFNCNSTSIRYHIDGTPQQKVNLDQLDLKETKIDKIGQQAIITVIRGNDDFNYTFTATVTEGIRFVNLTSTLTALHSGVHFDWVDIQVETKPTMIQSGDDKVTAGFVDVGTKAFGQLIFNTPPVSVSSLPSLVWLTYSLEAKPQGQIQLLATAYSESNNQQYYIDQKAMNAYFAPIMIENLKTALEPIPQTVQLDIFDYHSETLIRSISYIAVRNTEIAPKFRDDPLFSLVFINEEVAIFKVNGYLK